MALRNFRKHWKKYVAGQLLGMVVTSFLIKRLRERNVTREQCNAAKRFGEERVSMLEKPKKIMVFLNQTANKADAKTQFTKYAAPLLSLSGLDVTVVESEYQGHIQMLMHYVDPRTDGIIIAGGDGTVMEVLNGLMQRHDAEVARSMVLGVLPLGKENRSFKSWFPNANSTSQARKIGEATLRILHGKTKRIPLIEIHPEKGRTLFASSSVQWGVFKEAWKNRDRFWVFGKLRILVSHISTIIRGWPSNSSQSLWVIQSPPGELEQAGREGQSLEETGREGKDGGVVLKEEIAGFELSLGSSRGPDLLTLTTWPLALLSKAAFLQHGWCMTVSGACQVSGSDLVGDEFSVFPPVNSTPESSPASKSSPTASKPEPPSPTASSTFKPDPPSPTPSKPEPLAVVGTWLSVDGEQFEAVPTHIKLRPNHITLFT